MPRFIVHTTSYFYLEEEYVVEAESAELASLKIVTDDTTDNRLMPGEVVIEEVLEEDGQTVFEN